MEARQTFSQPRGQYIHSEYYGLAVPHGRQTNRWTAKQAAKEGARLPGHHPHVKSPRTPTLHFGVSAMQACEEAEAWHALQTVVVLRHGKPTVCRRRRDQPCALVGVVSVPPDLPTLQWPAFVEEVIEWLERKYGECLKSVFEHTDESQRHLHFWVVPSLGNTFESIHQGLQAVRALPKGATQEKRKAAFTAAMKTYQDEFFEAVGKAFGLLRTSVRGTRFTRAGIKLFKACRETAQKLKLKRELEEAERQAAEAAALQAKAREAARVRADLEMTEQQAAAAADAMKAQINVLKVRVHPSAQSGNLRDTWISPTHDAPQPNAGPAQPGSSASPPSSDSLHATPSDDSPRPRPPRPRQSIGSA